MIIKAFSLTSTFIILFILIITRNKAFIFIKNITTKKAYEN